jgi:hypothetical protein
VPRRCLALCLNCLCPYLPSKALPPVESCWAHSRQQGAASLTDKPL